jgi:hypothetical protein
MKQEEFEMKKQLLKLEADNDFRKHQYHMEELNKQMEIEVAKFENGKALQRIRSAEITKTINRKSERDFANSYSRNL